MKLFGHRLLCFLLLVHRPFELPSEHAFDSDRLNLIPNPFFFEETVEA